jgi:alcohol dehydrogenase class IV
MLAFDYRPLPWNIIFGSGSRRRLPQELDRMGFRRALVLCTPRQRAAAREVAALLAERSAGIFDGAAMHVPVEALERAAAQAARLNADCSIAIGGGSTTGLGKALALKLKLPNIALPTTYAGSEMTNIWGISEGGRKTTGRDINVVPRLTIYDPELTLPVPARVAGPSGMNAMAQAVVNLTATEVNPIVALYAEQAIWALSESLPKVVAQPTDLEARSKALYGACLAGAALGTGTTALHHRLCHVFGGTLNTPHADTHAILLPHCVAYNAPAVPDGTARVARAMGVTDAAAGLFDLAVVVGAPTSLADIGVREADLDTIVRIVFEQAIKNPAPVAAQAVRELLQRAYEGRRPAPSASGPARGA